MNERLAVGDASGPDFQEAFSLARGQDLNGKLAIENDSVREKLSRLVLPTKWLESMPNIEIYRPFQEVKLQDLNLL